MYEMSFRGLRINLMLISRGLEMIVVQLLISVFLVFVLGLGYFVLYCTLYCCMMPDEEAGDIHS